MIRVAGVVRVYEVVRVAAVPEGCLPVPEGYLLVPEGYPYKG